MARDREQKKVKFLEHYANSCNVTVSARYINVTRSTVYQWIDDDPEFAKSVENAREEGLDLIEAEVKRRAYDGEEVQYYNKDGSPGAIVRKYSDLLAMFFLKGHRPEKYREIREDRVSGKVAHEVFLKVEFVPTNGQAPVKQLPDAEVKLIDGKTG
jgi:hypothetical protein